MNTPPGGQRRAQKTLDAMPAAERTQQLERLLAKLKPGSDEYSSVAYVLARSGVDVWTNVRRMLIPYHLYRLGQHERIPENGDPIFPLPDALAEIYRRTREPKVLAKLLALRADGIVAELLCLVRTELFLDYPVEVLRIVARQPSSLKRLVEALRFEGEVSATRRKTKAMLRRMLHHRDPAVRRAARTCLRHLERPRRYL